MIRIFTIVLLVTVSTGNFSFAQTAIRLKRYNREIILTAGDRIKYKLVNGFVDVGRIDTITEEGFVVKQREILFEEVERIGRKGSGSNFYGIFLAGLGSMLSLSNFVQAVDPYGACTSCPGNPPPSRDGRNLMITMAMTAAGYMILTTHKTKSLERWTLDTVNRPDR